MSDFALVFTLTAEAEVTKAAPQGAEVAPETDDR